MLKKREPQAHLNRPFNFIHKDLTYKVVFDQFLLAGVLVFKKHQPFIILISLTISVWLTGEDGDRPL